MGCGICGLSQLSSSEVSWIERNKEFLVTLGVLGLGFGMALLYLRRKMEEVR